MGNFIDGSTATGVLLIVYSLTNESDIHYHAINKGNEQNNNISLNVTGLTGAEYGVSCSVYPEWWEAMAMEHDNY